MRTTVLVVALTFAFGAAAEAQQPVSAFGDLWMKVKSGDRVFVTDASGQETTGVFAKVSDSNLSVLVEGELRDIPSSDVREVARRGDSLWNGFLIGAGIGAVLGGVAFVDDCDDVVYGCLHPAAVAAFGGVAYGGIGALIDHFIKGRTVVFRMKGAAVRLRPDVSVERGQLRAALVWSSR